MAGGVAGSDDGRSVGNDFTESRWPVGKGFHQPQVAMQVVAEVVSDADAVVALTLQGEL